MHLDGLLEDQEALPKPSPIAVLQRKRDYKGWTWAVVDVDLSELGEKATRINVSLPQRVLRAIDQHARRSGETRSGFLARAAMDAMRESSTTRRASRAARIRTAYPRT